MRDSETWTDMEAGETWWGCAPEEDMKFLESLPGDRSNKTFTQLDEASYTMSQEPEWFFDDEEDIAECPALADSEWTIDAYVSAWTSCGWEEVSQWKNTQISAQYTLADAAGAELLATDSNTT